MRETPDSRSVVLTAKEIQGKATGPSLLRFRKVANPYSFSGTSKFAQACATPLAGSFSPGMVANPAFTITPPRDRRSVFLALPSAPIDREQH